jgi:Putative zinc-finger
VSSPHDHTSLGAYALGVLTPREATEVEAHLRTCPDGRREVADLVNMRAALDTIPPEAFIDGPPPGADLLLQRTLRRIRAEEDMESAPAPLTKRPSSVGRRLASVAAAVAIAGGAMVGGIFIGQGGDEAPPSAAGPAFTAQDQATGAKMDVHVEPLAGWVKVHAKVSGIRQGEQCKLVVTAKDNTQQSAGSWLVTETGEHVGTTLDGPALIAPKDVKSVDVITFDGRRLVSVPVNL